MSIIKKITLSLMIIGSISAQAFEKKKLPVFPSDFLYDNQPIEPACFYQLVGEDSTKEIDLSTHVCQNATTEFDVKQIPNGLLGYNLVDHQPSMSLPYIYYRLIGEKDPKSNQEYYVELQWSGGGSGNFKELILVQKKQGKLKLLETVASGDRCFGGVTHIQYQNGILKYSQNMTPAELGKKMGLSEAEGQKLGLTDCAVCCIGLGHVQQGYFQSFIFNPFDEKDLEGLVGPCFAKAILPDMGQYPKQLLVGALPVLANKIRQQCLTK
jgi:hypothetical protein